MFRSQVLCGKLLAFNVAAAACCVVAYDARASEPTVGTPPPNIVFKKLLNAPAGTDVSWKALRGKVAVLEFWATWCGPCVASIPGMNKLAVVHENDPIVFIHITDEEESVVTEFLKKTPIHGWVGIDSEGATFEKYGVTGRPNAAVVGKDGRFLGWTFPAELILEPEILREILDKGSSPELSKTLPKSADPLSEVPREGLQKKGTRNLCDIIIRRSTPESSGRFGGGDSRGLWSFDRSLLNHISRFCGFPLRRIVTEVPLPEEHYDILAMNSKARTAELEDIVCRLIGATFDLSFTREQREMDTYVLRLPSGRKPVLNPSMNIAYNDETGKFTAPNKDILERMKKGETFFFTMGPLENLADSLSGALGKPVVAELGSLPKEYDDYYTICFPYDKGDLASVIAGLEKHVGFTLAPASREVEVLVIGKAWHD